MSNNNLLLEKCLNLIQNMFDEKRCIFSYSTSIKDNSYINDFNNPLIYRYSINSFLGILKYNKHSNVKYFENEFDKFINLHYKSISNLGDKGLLLYALSISKHDFAKKILNELLKLPKKNLLNLNLQEISWLILGLVKYLEYFKNENVIEDLLRYFSILNTNYLNRDTLLPYHEHKFNLRKNFVSFGGIVYFLKSLYEYSNILDDPYSRIIFKELVEKVIKLQGYDGSWGWFYYINNPKVVDYFQIYSVHQDSMALLFLIPAEKLNIEYSKDAIKKSVNWLFGDNILNQNMINEQPFFIFRSIRRKKILNEKIERILRAYKNSILNKNDNLLKAKFLEINKECRSYHIGWIIYVWSDYHNFKEFLQIQKIK